MKNILLVDDESSLIMSMADGLESQSDQFRVYTASNGREAVETLETKPVDLVVTDLRMPEMDGFELLAYINDNRPSTPTIVMSAFATPRIEDKLKELGALQVISKPLDFERLAEAINQGLNHVFQGGSLAGISVGSFLQLMEAEQKTSLLEVLSEDRKKGFFYLDEGHLHDAVCGDKQGEDAAIEMLTWKGAQIRFRALPEKKLKKNIHQGLMSLLMEATHLEDERAGAEAGPPRDSLGEPDDLSLDDVEGGVGPESVLADGLTMDDELGEDDVVSGNLGEEDVSLLVEDLAPEEEKSTVLKVPGAEEKELFEPEDALDVEDVDIDSAVLEDDDDEAAPVDLGVASAEDEPALVASDPSFEDDSGLFDIDEAEDDDGDLFAMDEELPDDGVLFDVNEDGGEEDEGDLFAVEDDLGVFGEEASGLGMEAAAPSRGPGDVGALFEVEECEPESVEPGGGDDGDLFQVEECEAAPMGEADASLSLEDDGLFGAGLDGDDGLFDLEADVDESLAVEEAQSPLEAVEDDSEELFSLDDGPSTLDEEALAEADETFDMGFMGNKEPKPAPTAPAPRPIPKTLAAAPAPSAAPGKKTEEQVGRLKDILKHMAEEIEGVRVCAVSGMDGIGLAEHNPKNVDTQAFGAKFAMVMQLMEKSVQDLNIGHFQENLVQTDNAWVFTRFLCPEFYLVIAVGRESTLGSVRMVAGKYSKQLDEIFR